MPSFTVPEAIEIAYIPILNVLGLKLLTLFQGKVDIANLPLREVALGLIALRRMSPVMYFIYAYICGFLKGSLPTWLDTLLDVLVNASLLPFAVPYLLPLSINNLTPALYLTVSSLSEIYLLLLIF